MFLGNNEILAEIGANWGTTFLTFSGNIWTSARAQLSSLILDQPRPCSLTNNPGKSESDRQPALPPIRTVPEIHVVRRSDPPMQCRIPGEMIVMPHSRWMILRPHSRWMIVYNAAFQLNDCNAAFQLNDCNAAFQVNDCNAAFQVNDCNAAFQVNDCNAAFKVNDCNAAFQVNDCNYRIPSEFFFLNNIQG